MSEEEKNESGEITRREFLKDAGFIVGGAAIGAGIAYPLIPGKEVEVIKEVEVPVEVEKIKEVIVEQPVEVIKEVIKEVPVEIIREIAAEVGFSTFNINGDTLVAKIEPSWSLAYVLREKLHLTGTKRGCDVGNCGVCTVIMDGRPVMSCLVLGVEAAEGHKIETVEGLARDGQLTPLQQAMVENDATQCGFCTPGTVMTATALLRFNPSPSRDEIKEFMAGTLCRCGTQPHTIDAILQVGS